MPNVDHAHENLLDRYRFTLRDYMRAVEAEKAAEARRATLSSDLHVARNALIAFEELHGVSHGVL